MNDIQYLCGKVIAVIVINDIVIKKERKWFYLSLLCFDRLSANLIMRNLNYSFTQNRKLNTTIISLLTLFFLSG